MDFSSVSTITLSGAREFSRNWAADPNPVNLNGLARLEPEVAEALCGAKGGQASLELNGLKMIDVKLATALSRAGALFLHGLRKIDDASVEALAKGSLGWLSIPNVAYIGNDALRSLLMSPIQMLFLDGIRELTPDLLRDRVDTDYDQRELFVRSVTTLSEETAMEICRIKSSVDLSGITRLSDELAARFKKSSGHIALYGLKDVSATGAAHLLENPKIRTNLDLRSVAKRK